MAPESAASAIYIASPEGDTGKSTIALGILARLAATVAKVGVFRPIARTEGERRDYILELLLARTPAEVTQVVELCLAELSAQHAHTAAVVANRCDPTQLTEVAAALDPLAPKSYVLPEEPLLVAPSVAELRDAVHGTQTGGDEA